MKSFAFTKGLEFIHGEKRFTLLRRLLDGSFQLEGEDGELIKCSEAEIILGCSRGEWLVDEAALNAPMEINPKISRDISTFPEEVRSRVKQRSEYLARITKGKDLVMNFKEIGKQIAQIALELNDPHPPSPITLYRWYVRMKKGRDSNVDLVDRFEQRGRRLSWSKVVKDTVDQAIQEVYFNPQLYRRWRSWIWLKPESGN